MKKQISIIRLNTLEEMADNLFLIQQLTPSLTAKKYLSYLSEMLPHRYFQIAALLDGKTVGVSGYWLATKFYCGRYLEIDNFVVDESCRSKGVGECMIKTLEEIAREHTCDVMMLDAYLQNTRAHTFYERQHFKPKGSHFIKKLQ